MKYEFKMSELLQRKEDLIGQLLELNRDIMVAQLKCGAENGNRTAYSRIRNKIRSIDSKMSEEILEIVNSEYYRWVEMGTSTQKERII